MLRGSLRIYVFAALSDSGFRTFRAFQGLRTSRKE